MNEDPRPQARPQPMPQPMPMPAPAPMLQLALKPAPWLKPALVAVALSAVVAGGAWLFGAFAGNDPFDPAKEPARLAEYESGQSLRLEPVNLADRREWEEALKSLNVTPAEAEQLQKDLKAQSTRLVWLDVFDDVDEDGDIVAIKTSAFSKEIPIFHVPHRVAVPVALGEREILLTGVRDGRGGITVAVRANGRIVPLPRLRPGQPVGIPIL